MEPSSNFQKKIRIICSDHHATDSSTDEERDMNKRKNRIQGIERFVKENSYSPVTVVSSNENGERPLRKSCMSTGVRLRPSGKFSSQIRDPFKKKCVCLGTYSTEEEAAAAYQKKKREFEIKKASKKNKNSSAVPSSSVLDVNAIEVEVNNEQKAMKDQQVTIKKFVKEYEFVQESETTKGKEVSVKDSLKDDGSSIMVLWEPPSASDSWDELFGQCGFGDHMTNLRHHLLLNDNCINHLPETADLIELPDMEIDNEDMAWVNEILT